MKKAIMVMRMMEDHHLWRAVPLSRVKWRGIELVMELGL